MDKSAFNIIEETKQICRDAGNAYRATCSVPNAGMYSRLASDLAVIMSRRSSACKSIVIPAHIEDIEGVVKLLTPFAAGGQYAVVFARMFNFLRKKDGGTQETATFVAPKPIKGRFTMTSDEPNKEPEVVEKKEHTVPKDWIGEYRHELESIPDPKPAQPIDAAAVPKPIPRMKSTVLDNVSMTKEQQMKSFKSRKNARRRANKRKRVKAAFKARKADVLRVGKVEPLVLAAWERAMIDDVCTAMKHRAGKHTIRAAAKSGATGSAETVISFINTTGVRSTEVVLERSSTLKLVYYWSTKNIDTKI